MQEVGGVSALSVNTQTRASEREKDLEFGRPFYAFGCSVIFLFFFISLSLSSIDFATCRELPNFSSIRDYLNFGDHHYHSS